MDIVNLEYKCILLLTLVTLPNLVMESPCLRPAESAGLPATTTITRAKGGPTASRGLASLLQNSDELCHGMT